MKPRNREVTIFSLSMMDVISGAMGAFLVLVVILSRHYQPDLVTTETILNLQKELVEATGYLDEASNEIRAGSRDTADIEHFLREAKSNVNAGKAYISQLRSELDEANARIHRLEEEIGNLEKRIAELETELASWKPFAFLSYWSCDRAGDVDIYLLSPGETKDDRTMGPFDPRAQQGRLFSDDIHFDYTGASDGTEIWFSGRNFSDQAIKVYYRLETDTDEPPTCTVRSWLVSNYTEDTKIDKLKLTPEQPWLFVGTINVLEDRDVEYVAASPRDRETEHADIMRRINTR